MSNNFNFEGLGSRPQFGIGAEDRFAETAEFYKALQAGYGTDHASLTGGAALRLESLDPTLFTVTQTNDDFKLWQDLAKSRATATVDEWTRKPSLGGFIGSAFNSELGAMIDRTGTYERKTAQVKYLMTKRSISVVQSMQKTTVASESQEMLNGTLELLTSVEHASFYGDGGVIPETFDGLYKAMLAEGSPSIDARGGKLDPESIMFLAGRVAGLKRFGRLTHMYTSHLVQADLDTDLTPAMRINLDNTTGAIVRGAPVNAIRTTWGNIKVRPDPFAREWWEPYEVFETGATSVDPSPPASVAAAATGTDGSFDATMLGAYYWAAVSVNRKGVSTIVKSSQVTVAATQRVDVTITRSVAADETGYYVYRTRLGDTNTTANFRYFKQVAVAGATTVVADRNTEIPGTSCVFLLDLGGNRGPAAVSIRQLMPMTKFQLFPSNTAEIPWAQLLFLYLRMTLLERCAIIRNIVPSQATWKPFSLV